MLSTALDADSIAGISGVAERLMSQNAELIAEVHELTERNRMMIERHEAMLIRIEQEARG